MSNRKKYILLTGKKQNEVNGYEYFQHNIYDYGNKIKTVNDEKYLCQSDPDCGRKVKTYRIIDIGGFETEWGIECGQCFYNSHASFRKQSVGLRKVGTKNE